MYELRRLLCDPGRILLLLMIALCNLALFAGYCRTLNQTDDRMRQQMEAWGTDYDEYLAEQKAAAEEAAERYLTETYPQYLEYVQSQSGTQSVLGKLAAKKDDFVQRNLEKTAKDYQKLQGITVRRGCNETVNAVKDYDVTDYLLLIAPLLLVLSLAADTETAVGALTRTTKRGRLPLCAWQALSVLLMSALSVLLLYGVNIAYACTTLGDPVLSRAIQSVPEFQLCALRISVGGYFLGAALLKTLAVTVFALFIWLMQSRVQPLAAWGISGAAIAGFFLMHKLILPTAKLSHFKFMNPFAALESDVFFTQYSNLNWFGHPSNFRTDMLFAVGGLAVLLTLLCLVFIGICRPGKLGSGIERLGDRITQKFAKFTRRRTLFGFEGWKILTAQRGFLVLLIAALLGFSLWQQTHLYVWVSQESKTLYTRYAGEITQEKQDDVADRLAALADQIARQQQKIAQMEERGANPSTLNNAQYRLQTLQHEFELYSALQEEFSKLTDYTARTGLPAWFIQQNAYQLLFKENASVRRCCMILLLYLIFMFRSLHAYDNRYDTEMLLRATKRGRGHRRTAAWLWVMILSAAAVIGLHGIYFVRLRQDVGFQMPEAPAQSMELLQWIPVSVTLKTVIIAQIVLRYFAALLVAGGTVQISRFSRTPETALLVALAVFLLPSALAESGITQLHFADFVHWLSVTAAR